MLEKSLVAADESSCLEASIEVKKGANSDSGSS